MTKDSRSEVITSALALGERTASKKACIPGSEGRLMGEPVAAGVMERVL